MVEVKESTYKEILLTQLHFILGIWSALKVFTDLYCLFKTFIVDVTFGKILKIWNEKSHHSKVGEIMSPYSYTSRAKSFISANVQEPFERCRANS